MEINKGKFYLLQNKYQPFLPGKFADLGNEEKEKRTSEGSHKINSSPALGSKC